MRPGHGGRAQLHGSRVSWLASRSRIAHARRTRDLQPLACCSSSVWRKDCCENRFKATNPDRSRSTSSDTSHQRRLRRSGFDSHFRVSANKLAAGGAWGTGTDHGESDHPRVTDVPAATATSPPRVSGHLRRSDCSRWLTCHEQAGAAAHRPRRPRRPRAGGEIRFGESAEEASLARRFRVLLRPRSDLVGRTFTRHAKTSRIIFESCTCRYRVTVVHVNCNYQVSVGPF